MAWECKKEKKSSSKKWFVFFLLLIVLLLGIMLVIIFSSEKNVIVTSSFGNLGDGMGVLIDLNEKNEQSPPNDHPVEQGVAISGRGVISIPANKKEVTVHFYNPQKNEKRYYLTFELRLYDKNKKEYEVLYTSGLVEPGKRINQITLSHELEAGTYEAVVHVQPYRMDEEKTLTNNVDMKIELIVK